MTLKIPECYGGYQGHRYIVGDPAYPDRQWFEYLEGSWRVTIRPGRSGETLGFRAVEDGSDFEALWAAFRRICDDLGFEWWLSEFQARGLFERSGGRGVFFAWVVADWVREPPFGLIDRAVQAIRGDTRLERLEIAQWHALERELERARNLFALMEAVALILVWVGLLWSGFHFLIWLEAAGVHHGIVGILALALFGVATWGVGEASSQPYSRRRVIVLSLVLLLFVLLPMVAPL